MVYLPEKGKHLPKPSFLGCQPLVFGVLVPLFGMDFLEKDMGLLVGSGCAVKSLFGCRGTLLQHFHLAGGWWFQRLGGTKQKK